MCYNIFVIKFLSFRCVIFGIEGAGMLQPADRRMLQAVRDTLSHVRRPAAGTTGTSPRHDLESSPSSAHVRLPSRVGRFLPKVV